mgnify:FL=1
MLTISFTEYDDLDQKAELFEVPEDYEFPLRESFQSKLDEKHGLFDLMVAFYNTTDSDYREELRRFMYQEVKIVDSLEDNNPIGKAVKGQLKISSEKNMKIMQNVQNMDFQLTGYFPTKQDIDDYVKDNSETNLAFLYWILNTPMDDLSEDELDTMNYIKTIIERRVKLEE